VPREAFASGPNIIDEEKNVKRLTQVFVLMALAGALAACATNARTDRESQYPTSRGGHSHLA